jgi:hypoxanthine phosphoribosyltransferase
VRELAGEINADFGVAEEVTAICTLKGGVVFFADLVRQLKMPVVCEFLGVSSYGQSSSSSGEVKVTLDVSEPLLGKHVLIVEDIADSGLTLSYLQNYLQMRKPASLKTVSLLFKPDALKVEDLK